MDLTTTQLDEIGSVVSQVFHGPPPRLNEFISWVPSFASRFASVHGLSTPKEVAVAAFAWAYGPSDRGRPPQAVVEWLLDEVATYDVSDLRAWERSLVFSVLEREAKGGWFDEWEKAIFELCQLVRATISQGSIWKIGRIVLGKTGNGLTDWVREESTSCSHLITLQLIRGCRCWERWADFCIESAETAQRNCESHHFAYWNRQQSLRSFLFDALEGARWPRVNQLRKGMLVKELVDDQTGKAFVAGPVLRCRHPGCGGTIWIDGQCSAVDRHDRSAITDASWWIWREGQRIPWSCCRCMRCNAFYVRNEQPLCSGGAAHQWSRRLTEVWVSSNGLSAVEFIDELLWDMETPLLQACIGEQEKLRSSWVTIIESWPQDAQSRLLLGMLRDRRSIHQISKQLRLTRTRLRQLMHEAFFALYLAETERAQLNAGAAVDTAFVEWLADAVSLIAGHRPERFAVPLTHRKAWLLGLGRALKRDA